jgi:SAM-dependent methyltransferase
MASAKADPYRRSARTYSTRHVEIFNPPEQDRLRAAVKDALAHLREPNPTALDFGCGTGNLTHVLTELGMSVVAADVSPAFVSIASRDLGVETLLLDAGSAESVPDQRFDLIAMYSVLHHIPDYLAAVTTLTGKLRPGGVLLIDHEHNAEHWAPSPALAQFTRAVAMAARHAHWWAPDHRRWQHLARAAVSPSRHILRTRRWINPRYSPEGDIHVWPDDHIDFDAIANAAAKSGGYVITRFDYLHYKPEYPLAVWDAYREACSNMGGVLIGRAS